MTPPARAATLVGGTLVEAQPLSGGNLSTTWRIVLADGRRLVVKAGDGARREAEMLAAIASTGAPTPAVEGVSDDLLVMDEVSSQHRLAGEAWAWLSDALVRLHVPTHEPYGWSCNHAFGSVAIVNDSRDLWPSFWGEHRLAPFVPHLPRELARRIERLLARLDEHLPATPPAALLHGDLWGGNVLVGSGGLTLIDPACYYGDREVDIAMLTLFDHPPREMLEALDLAPGWPARQPVYRLWPLLVHLTLFGAGYRGGVEAALQRLGA